MPTYIELARAYVLAKDTAAAEATLKQALTIDPRSIEILLALGDFRVTTGKPDQAEIMYKQALEIAPENEEIYLRLASFYQHSVNGPKMEATLQKLARAQTSRRKAAHSLGRLLYMGLASQTRLSPATNVRQK